MHTLPATFKQPLTTKGKANILSVGSCLDQRCSGAVRRKRIGRQRGPRMCKANPTVVVMVVQNTHSFTGSKVGSFSSFVIIENRAQLFSSALVGAFITNLPQKRHTYTQNTPKRDPNLSPLRKGHTFARTRW